MTTESMSEIQRSSSSKSQSNQGQALDSRSIKSIQLADGWHNVSNCEVVPFSITNSPAYQYFPTLSYRNEDGQQVYTPLKQILSFSQDNSSFSQENSAQGTMGSSS